MEALHVCDAGCQLRLEYAELVIALLNHAARTYPTPELEAVLGKTLGLPLFQESAMRVAMVCAGFTGGEADQLRKSMATFKFTGGVSRFKDK